MFLKLRFAALTFAIGLVSWGQVERGAVTGTITDKSGAVIAGAVVKAQNEATQVVSSATTDGQGTFVIQNLLPGPYRISVTQKGFRTATQSGVVVAVGDRLRADFSLELGQVNESVEVTAVAPLIQSETSTAGTVITQKTIADLPLNGRSFIGLLPLSAGVTTGRRGDILNGRGVQTRRGATAFTANGMRDTSNNFLIDGIDNNEMSVSTIVYFPSIDAVQEFRVQTSVSDAEVGRNGGGTVNLTIKAGSNELHGTVYHFLRNDVLDARNFFAPPTQPTPPLKRNQFGFSLGGPIRRNKTFFFGDYEGRNFVEASTFVSTVPTMGARSGDFTGLPTIFDPLTYNATTRERQPFAGNRIPQGRFDTAGSNVLKLYPAPTSNAIVANYVLNAKRTTSAHQGDVRVDHYFSERDNLFVRYSIADSDIYQPGELGEVGGSPFLGAGRNLVPLQQAVITHSHLFSSSLLNNLRVGFTRFTIDHTNLNFGRALSTEVGIPTVNLGPETSGLTLFVPAGYQSIGDSSFTPAFLTQNTWHIQENLAWTRAAHNVKFGFDVRARQLNFFQATNPRGRLPMSPNITNNPARPAGTGDSMASLLLGYADSGAIDRFVTGPYGQRYQEWGLFVKDDWKVTKNLTLNLGLRWDLYTPLVEQYDRMSNFDFATGQVILAGQQWGRGLVSTDTNNFAPRFGFAWQPRGMKKMAIRGGFGIFYNIEASTGNRRLSENAPFLVSPQYVNDLLNPVRKISEGFPLNLNFDPARPAGVTLRTWDRDLPQGYTTQFNFTVENEIFANTVLRTRYAGTRGVHLMLFSNENQPLPGAGAVAARRPFPALGDFLSMKPRGNLSYHSLQIEVERRFSGGLSFVSALTLAKTIDDGDRNESDVENVRNYAREKSLSRFHIGKRWVTSFVWETPLGKGKRWGANWNRATDLILGGWQTNGVLTLQSGPPFEPQTADRTNGAGGRRPDRIADGNLPSSERTLSRWFDKSAFAIPALYTYGNSGRNVLFGPGLVNLDFSLFKNFRITERVSLQFRAESFNLTNTPSFNLPNQRVDLPAGGVITSADEPRRNQLALKVIF